MYVSLLPKGTVMCLSLLNTCIFSCIYRRTQEHLGSQETKRGHSRATDSVTWDLRATPWCGEATLFPLFSASWGKSVQQEQMWPFDQSPSENKQLPWQPENTMWDMNWPLRLSLMLQDLHMYACLWCKFPSYENMLRVKTIIYFISFSYPLVPLPSETVQIGNNT